VLLMDEPLSNLDALLRLGFRAELKKLVAELGTTTVYVTHDQVEALSLGDRVAVMRAGRIEQVASALHVYDHPVSEFVGGFIGSPPMNFLTGTVTDGHVDFAGVRVPAPAHLGSFAGREVRLGIRAETISIVEEGTPDAMPAVVQVYEPLGSSVLLTTELGGQTLKIQAPARFRAQPGDRVWIQLGEEHQRWFDPQTALALHT
jgi:multiple sugar transport system ATP-binding protein